jgi:HTH-type transcriptional regulator / antitoxin HipB
MIIIPKKNTKNDLADYSSEELARELDRRERTHGARRNGKNADKNGAILTDEPNDRYNSGTMIAMPRPKQTVGQRIADARSAKALSQTDLGEKAHISQTAISNIEKGKAKPRPSTIRRIASVLGISAAELTV